MKKKIYFRYIIYLILALITCNAFLNLLNFNCYSIENFSLNDFVYWEYNIRFKQIEYFILNFVATGCISLFFNYLAKRSIEKNILKSENKEQEKETSGELTQEEKKKIRKIFTYINFISCFVFSAVYYICNWKYFLELSIFKYMEGIKIVSPVILIITALVQNLLVLIPSSILINTFFKEKKVNSEKRVIKILKKITSITTLIIFTILMWFNIYNYVNIPEFEYQYVWEIQNDGEYAWTIVEDYQNKKRCLSEEPFVVPKKIWGKEVKGLFLLSNKYSKELNLPNTIDYRWILLASYGCGFEKISMSGEPIEWFVKNNVVYNIDGTEMYVTDVAKDEHIYVSEKINRIYGVLGKITLEVSENNPYFYVHDNVIWNKNNYINYLKTYYTENINYGMVFNNSKDENIILPESISGKIEIDVPSGWGNIKLTIPEGLENEIEIVMNSIGIDEYIVEEENQYYAVHDGNLYNKDYTSLIAMNDSYSKTIKLPNTLENIENKEAFKMLNEKFYSQKRENELFSSKLENYENKPIIEIDRIKDVDALVFENNTLYNKQSQKILVNFDGTYNLDENVKELDETLIKSFGAYAYVSVKSPKIELNERNTEFLIIDNDLYNKEKTKLLYALGSVLLPKELKQLSKENLIQLANRTIELESEEYFTLYKDNLYTKDKKKLLAVGNTDTIIIPKETQYIDEAVYNSWYFEEIYGESQGITGINTKKIILEEGNEYFSTENNILYNKDKTKVLLIGNYENNEDWLNSNVQYIQSNMIWGARLNEKFNYSNCKYIKTIDEIKIIYKDEYKYLEKPYNQIEF